ncbi:MAG TPA: hypothetical protein VMP67_00700 [Candidatus Limnocylindria bacterium]|nr:hypothetical protein [Candidatus Limnocylindria bacterium]
MDEPRPNVLIVGGFMTAPPNYWPLRRRLLARGAERVDICPLWPPDWVLAGLLGLGLIMHRTGRAVARTWRAGGQRPIIVVAHSGGGIAARLAMSHLPFHGRRAGVAEAVGCLVTLGTPHLLSQLSNRYHHAGHDAVDFLERETPGAYFAPRTAYLTVGSSYRATPFKNPVGRAADELFAMVVGRDEEPRGDGIVPAAAVHLQGAQQLTYEDVRHGHIGANWYGASGIVERWWPAALDLWRDALEARERGLGPLGPTQAELARDLEDASLGPSEATLDRIG